MSKGRHNQEKDIGTLQEILLEWKVMLSKGAKVANFRRNGEKSYWQGQNQREKDKKTFGES